MSKLIYLCQVHFYDLVNNVIRMDLDELCVKPLYKMNINNMNWIVIYAGKSLIGLHDEYFI